MIAALNAAAALLLVVSGAAKLRTPAPVAAMIATLLGRRLPAPSLTVRLIGLAEIATGAAVLAIGGAVPALLLVAMYSIFAAVTLRLLGRSRPGSGATRPGCGCFGRADAPVSAAHLVLDLVVVGCAVGAAVTSLPRAGGVYSHGATAAATGGVQVLLLAWLGYLSITALPALSSARRLLSPKPEEAR